MKNLVNALCKTGIAGIGAFSGGGIATLLALNPVGGAILGGIAFLGLVASAEMESDDD